MTRASHTQDIDAAGCAARPLDGRPSGAVVGSRTRQPAQETARRRFILNVGSNLCYVALNTTLMMWYVPYLVGHLGVATYGMISLANSLVMYAAIVSTALDAAINRFLAIDINQGNDLAANRTFNTALAISVVACGILLLPVTIVAYYFPVLFNVPPGLEVATQALFFSVAIPTLMTMLGANFGVAALITHRFDLRNIVRALTSLTRAGVVVACFQIWPASLWLVAVGFAASACVSFTGDILVWRRLTPQLRIDPRCVDGRHVRALMGLSSWVTVSVVGFLLLTQIDLLVVNAVFGPEKTGLYGSVLLLQTLVYSMLETVASVLSPAIMARYAVGDLDGMRRLAGRTVKILAVGLALPVGLMCGFSRPLLTLWLGPDFAGLDVLMMLLIAPLTVNLAVRPFSYVLTAYNRLRLHSLVTLGLGVADICLAIALALWSPLGMVGVALAGAIMWTFRNAVFLSINTAYVIGLRWWAFSMPLLGGALGTIGVILLCWLVSSLWGPATWWALGIAAASIGTGYALLAYAFALDRSDRAFLWSLVKGGFGR